MDSIQGWAFWNGSSIMDGSSLFNVMVLANEGACNSRSRVV